MKKAYLGVCLCFILSSVIVLLLLLCRPVVACREFFSSSSSSDSSLFSNLTAFSIFTFKLFVWLHPDSVRPLTLDSELYKQFVVSTPTKTVTHSTRESNQLQVQQ